MGYGDKTKQNKAKEIEQRRKRRAEIQKQKKLQEQQKLQKQNAAENQNAAGIQNVDANLNLNAGGNPPVNQEVQQAQDQVAGDIQNVNLNAGGNPPVNQPVQQAQDQVAGDIQNADANLNAGGNPPVNQPVQPVQQVQPVQGGPQQQQGQAQGVQPQDEEQEQPQEEQDGDGGQDNDQDQEENGQDDEEQEQDQENGNQNQVVKRSRRKRKKRQQNRKKKKEKAKKDRIDAQMDLTRLVKRLKGKPTEEEISAKNRETLEKSDQIWTNKNVAETLTREYNPNLLEYREFDPKTQRELTPEQARVKGEIRKLRAEIQRKKYALDNAMKLKISGIEADIEERMAAIDRNIEDKKNNIKWDTQEKKDAIDRDIFEKKTAIEREYKEKKDAVQNPDKNEAKRLKKQLDEEEKNLKKQLEDKGKEQKDKLDEEKNKKIEALDQRKAARTKELEEEKKELLNQAEKERNPFNKKLKEELKDLKAQLEQKEKEYKNLPKPKEEDRDRVAIKKKRDNGKYEELRDREGKVKTRKMTRMEKRRRLIRETQERWAYNDLVFLNKERQAYGPAIKEAFGGEKPAPEEMPNVRLVRKKINNKWEKIRSKSLDNFESMNKRRLRLSLDDDAQPQPAESESLNQGREQVKELKRKKAEEDERKAQEAQKAERKKQKERDTKSKGQFAKLRGALTLDEAPEMRQAEAEDIATTERPRMQLNLSAFKDNEATSVTKENGKREYNIKTVFAPTENEEEEANRDIVVAGTGAKRRKAEEQRDKEQVQNTAAQVAAIYKKPKNGDANGEDEKIPKNDQGRYLEDKLIEAIDKVIKFDLSKGRSLRDEELPDFLPEYLKIKRLAENIHNAIQYDGVGENGDYTEEERARMENGEIIPPREVSKELQTKIKRFNDWKGAFFDPTDRHIKARVDLITDNLYRSNARNKSKKRAENLYQTILFHKNKGNYVGQNEAMVIMNKKNRPKFNMLKKMKEVEKSSQGLKRRHDLLKRWQAQLDKPVAQNGENRALDDGQIVNEVLNANPQDQAPIQNVNENDNAQNANGNNNAQQAGQQQGGAGGNQNRNGNFDMEAEIRRYLGENPEEDEEELREEFRKMDEEFNKAWGINNEEKAEGNQQKAEGNQQKAEENQQKAEENQQKAGENQQKADENKAKGNDQKIDEQLRELEEEVRNDEENAEENRENEQPKDDLLGAEDNAAVNAKNAALAQVFGGVSAKVGELSVKHKAELAKKKSSRFMKVLQNYMTGEAGPGKNDEQIRKMITEMQKVNPGLQQAAAITQEAVSDLINTVLIKPLYEVFGAAEIDAVQDLQTKLITEWKKPDNPVYKALLAAVQKNMPAQQNAA